MTLLRTRLEDDRSGPGVHRARRPFVDRNRRRTAGDSTRQAMKVNRLTHLPNLFWDTAEEEACADILSDTFTAPVFGQFSIIHEEEGNHHLIRDRVGLNKLFYHVDPISKTLTVGHYLVDVARATQDYNGVLSVPAGHHLVIDGRTLERRLVSYWDLRLVQPITNFRVEDTQDIVDESLTSIFTELQRLRPDGPFFVCLSGGLDSAVVAAYARRRLKNVTAVSFSYERLSDDFRAAEAIAGRLGLPFLPVIARRRLDPDLLDDVLLYGQDWRDFNVHCAWVNHHIARRISEVVRPDEAVVLTGDLMNEFVADYTPVKFGGVVYYPQPRIPRNKLRRFLVYGLDSGDRELGIFYRHGLTVVQPYSLAVEAYLSVPGDFLADDRCKEQLNYALLSRVGETRVGDCLLKAKVRAQVGSEDGGTLGLFHEARITQQALEERWRTLFAPLTREGKLEPMIVSGRYRFEDPHHVRHHRNSV